MSASQAKPDSDPQRGPRNWIADTLIVAGVLAFGYFAVSIEAGRQHGGAAPGPASPLELLR